MLNFKLTKVAKMPEEVQIQEEHVNSTQKGFVT